jgi:hypothetical protein
LRFQPYFSDLPEEQRPEVKAAMASMCCRLPGYYLATICFEKLMMSKLEFGDAHVVLQLMQALGMLTC